jgi:LPXTG-site transpeptidase (sortase) family protein
MTLNPLLPKKDDRDEQPDKRAALSSRHDKRIEPVANPAADFIRQKLDRLYVDEPDTKEEIAEVQAEPAPERTKHQQFMYDLSTSGKSLAQIQTEWHNYYVNLPDDEKHEVWQEFYSANSNKTHFNQFAGIADEEAAAIPPAGPEPEQKPAVIDTPANPLLSDTKPTGPVVSEHEVPEESKDRRKPSDIKDQLLSKIGSSPTAGRAKLTAKHHLQSLLFGLGFGGLVILIVLFSFFNEVVIAPFIQPSRHVSATPIIVGTDGIASSKTPQVIIPKINVEIPLAGFNLKGTDEAAVETALEDGVTHYPTTVLPGQKGNTAFFGHSSNNIFNPGKYKFAFVLLHELVPGDTFYLSYGGKVYSYQVYDKKIVSPNQVDVLNDVKGKTATATLITCDPPGTSINRLVIWGEQTSPSPAGNTAAAATPTTGGQEQELVGNGPSLWSRMVNGVKSWF